MPDFTRITTRGGDRGETSLADGSRRPKHDLIIEALGEVDELHAALGLLKTALGEKKQRDTLERIQLTLIKMGGQLAIPPSHPAYRTLDRVGKEDVEILEVHQAVMMNKVEIPSSFVTYGETERGARADLARALCRRAERRLVALIRERGMTDMAGAQQYLNRLSDWLFVLARLFDAEQ